MSRGRVFATQLPPFLSSLSGSLSQDLLQHDESVFFLGSNAAKQNQTPAEGCSGACSLQYIWPRTLQTTDHFLASPRFTIPAKASCLLPWLSPVAGA